MNSYKNRGWKKMRLADPVRLIFEIEFLSDYFTCFKYN